MEGFFERFPLPPNYYAQRFTDSAACWSVDQVALSLWLRHCLEVPPLKMAKFAAVGSRLRRLRLDPGLKTV